ncbi:hypothetical protein JG687_00012311 [Phytophthora cactorum]|uniref:RXLR phytopathogen effector protein WY-domain domain-containing protein n=1 Tax=Phytophthora cactorum TaxID=29920 RepID=A0A8T1U4P8_9STRA|nr:hypothetical protein JG687_00012311 [Phytophthora cactorum]
MREKRSPKEVFKLLRLKNTNTRLENNPELLGWLRYTMTYRDMMGGSKWYPDGEIYLRLLKVAPEAQLATFFQSLRNIPDLKVVGENLQKTQYAHWRTFGMQPRDLAKSLGIMKLLESGAVKSDPRYLIYDGYLSFSKIKLD